MVQIKDIEFHQTPVLSGIIVNNSDKNIKDVVLDCDLKAESGTSLTSFTKVIYQQFPRGKASSFKPLTLESWYPTSVNVGTSNEDLKINIAEVKTISYNVADATIE